MIIDKIHIEHFRNITSASIPCSPHFNIFYGINGSGKTSLLEAIYTLSHGKSFRTHNIEHIIQQNTPAFRLFCQLSEAEKSHQIGIERDCHKARKVRLDNETVKTASTIAKLLPVQLITIDSYRYFTDGPKQRREFLDWGVFHVKHLFIEVWKAFQRTLKQRNAALKARAPISEIHAWNEAFIKESLALTSLRESYIQEFIPIYQKILDQLLPNYPTKLIFSAGWQTETSLEKILLDHYRKDLALGYTTTGPQRADLQLYIETSPAHEILSQGQQKLASYALQLAQGHLYQSIQNRAPIYLIDDLPSELDPKNRAEITKYIAKMDAQAFITGITTADLCDALKQPDTQMFHVKQGNITHSVSNGDSLNKGLFSKS